MNQTFHIIEEHLLALHFEEALALLQNMPDAEIKQNPFSYWICLSRVERGLYHYTQAFQAARKALQAAAAPDQKEAASTEEAKSLFSSGKTVQALEILEKLMSKPHPSFPALLAWTFMLVELGRLEEAQPAIEQIQEQIEQKTVTDPRLQADACTLLGDYYSFCENPSQSQYWYQNCLVLIESSFPKNWADLRRALLFNNYGDLFEQQESYGKALELYEQALDNILQVSQAGITDYSAYLLEILFSLANVYANMDDNDQALPYLSQIEEVLKKNPPLQKQVFEARFLYMRGLLELYEDTPVSCKKAIEDLRQAYALQLELMAKGLVKLEHIGKTAYYLASTLPEDPYYALERKEMLEKALDIFMKVKDKEPAFYLSGIAEIENDLGTCLLESDLSRSIFYYEQALDDYTAYHNRYPEDALSLESRMFVMMNLITAWHRNSQNIESERCARSLMEVMESTTRQWPELRPSLAMLSGRLQTYSFLPVSLRRQAACLEEECQEDLFKA